MFIEKSAQVRMIAAARIQGYDGLSQRDVKAALAEVVVDIGGEWRLSGAPLPDRTTQFWIETSSPEVFKRADLAPAMAAHLVSLGPECIVFLGSLLGERTAE